MKQKWHDGGIKGQRRKQQVMRHMHQNRNPSHCGYICVCLVTYISFLFFFVFQETWWHVLWGKSGEEDGQQRWKARRNEAAGDEPDKTRDGTVGKQQKGCSKKEKGRKEKQKVWMAWDGQQVTRQGKRNQKLSCAQGLRCPRIPGERAGMWGCRGAPQGLCYLGPLCPIHRRPLLKQQTRILL